jgi:hypothetical protein
MESSRHVVPMVRGADHPGRGDARRHRVPRGVLATRDAARGGRRGLTDKRPNPVRQPTQGRASDQSRRAGYGSGAADGAGDPRDSKTGGRYRGGSWSERRSSYLPPPAHSWVMRSLIDVRVVIAPTHCGVHGGVPGPALEQRSEPMPEQSAPPNGNSVAVAGPVSTFA